MASRIDANHTLQSSSPHLRSGSQRSQHGQTRHESLASSLSWNKSSDSASTGTAVTAPEDEGNNSAKVQSYDLPINTLFAQSAAARQHHRTRIEHQRDSRQSRELPARDIGLRNGPSMASSILMHRRDNISQNISTEYGKKDKGKEIDRSATSNTIASSRHFLVDPAEVARKDRHGDRPEGHIYSGSLAQAEFERMKKEIESLKKAATSKKKMAKKQAKKIEELKAQIFAETTAKKEQETQAQILKAKIERQAELVTSLEHSLQCQICMDLLHKPHALSPCGHILCLHCLQEWFRKAPRSADESDVEDEDDPRYTLTRPKSCPCCRAIIIRRPVPVFIVKAISSALATYKAGAGANDSYHNRSPTPDGDDPWNGIFPSSDGEGAESDSSDEERSYEDAIGWAMHGLWRDEIANQFAVDRHFAPGYEDIDITSESDSGEGDEEDEGEFADSDSLDEDGSDRFGNVYVAAQWQPPSVTIDSPEAVLGQGNDAAPILPMLRRGCTADMIRIFKIVYIHNQGLIAHLPSLDELWITRVMASPTTTARDNRVFLGWNVKLSEGDYTGDLYMEAVLNDLTENPARWMWTERPTVPGAYDVKRLVRAEDIEDYDTTDTEVWLYFNDSYR